VQTHEVALTVEPVFANGDERHRFRAFKTALFEEERFDVGILGLRRLVETCGQSVGERHLAVALHHERQSLHFQGTEEVASAVQFASVGEMLVDVFEIFAQMLVFGIENDTH